MWWLIGSWQKNPWGLLPPTHTHTGPSHSKQHLNFKPHLQWEILFDLGGYKIIFTCVFQAGRLLLNESDFSAFQNNFLPTKHGVKLPIILIYDSLWFFFQADRIQRVWESHRRQLLASWAQITWLGFAPYVLYGVKYIDLVSLRR